MNLLCYFLFLLLYLCHGKFKIKKNSVQVQKNNTEINQDKVKNNDIIKDCDFTQFVAAVENIENNSDENNKKGDIVSNKEGWELKEALKTLWLFVCPIFFGIATNSWPIGITLFVLMFLGIFGEKIISVLSKKVFKFFLKLPHQNYHILGYVTFLYLVFIIIVSGETKIDYAYYEILRWLVTCFSVWSAVKIYNKNHQSVWILLFFAIAILFNPVIKISFDNDTWAVIDIATAILFVINAIRKK